MAQHAGVGRLLPAWVFRTHTQGSPLPTTPHPNHPHCVALSLMQAQLATLANLGITPPPSAVAAPNTPTATTSADLGSATQLATVQHVARLTAALAQWLPPFWGLTQVRMGGPAGGRCQPCIHRQQSSWCSVRPGPAVWWEAHPPRKLACPAQGFPKMLLPQARLPGLASIGNAAASVEAGMAEAEAAAGRVIAAIK